MLIPPQIGRNDHTKIFKNIYCSASVAGIEEKNKEHVLFRDILTKTVLYKLKHICWSFHHEINLSRVELRSK